MKLIFTTFCFLALSSGVFSQNIADSLNYYYENNDYKSAIRIIESTYHEQLSNSARFDVFHLAIDIFMTVKEFDKALKYIDLESEIHSLTKDQIALLNLDKAKLFVKMGRLKESEPFFIELEKYLQNAKPDSTFLMNYNLVKVIFYDESGQYKKAMEYATNLLKYIDRKSDLKSKASLYITVGEIFRMNDLLDKALYYYQKAEEIAKEQEYLGLLGRIYNNQSIVLSKKNEMGHSVDKLKESARLYNEVYGDVSAAPAYHNLGIYYLEIKNFDSARLYFQKVLDIGKKNEFSKAEYFGYLGLGMYYQQLKNYSEGESYLAKAMKIAKQNNNPADQGRAYEQLYSLYDEAGRYKESLTYFKLSNELRDSLKMAENKAIIDGLESKYRLSESERENKSLRLKQTRQRLSFFIAGGIILLLLFLIIVFYLGIRARNKKNKLLSLQKYEIDKKNKQLQDLYNKINAQNSQLEELNRTKDSMFSIISHDLRSPLGSVYMLMNMLDSEDGYSKQSASMVSELAHEVHHALLLLNNLMAWAHINIHDLKAIAEIIPLKTTLDEILSYHEKDIARKKITLEIAIDDDNDLLADKGMSEFVMKNIISNAIKFSNENETIFIKATREDHFIIIEFQNKGAEIPEGKIKEIFEPGVRLQKGTKGERGAGLGLAICKTYINVMDAEMELTSNEGLTTVKLTFTSGPL